MDIQDISAENLATLTAQGYTETDLGMLGQSEIDSLLAVPPDSDVTDVEAKPAKADESQSETPTEEAQAADGPFVPQYQVEVPADATEQIKALKDEDSAAFKRLMDGEIDSDEYQAVKQRVESAVDDLKSKAMTAAIFQQANEQAAQQAAQLEWKRSESAAFDAFKGEGLDYKGKPALLAAYNTHLKALGSDPKNEARDAAWFLQEAHKLTKADLGITTATKKVAPNGGNAVDLNAIPPTLRSAPVAATGAVNADEFAHMRNLSGVALERAHAALTEAQRDRWMAE